MTALRHVGPADSTIKWSREATAATVTRISLPEKRKAEHDDRFSAPSVAVGGTLGILIPPSIILIIYCAITEESVPRLFAASLLPGILLLPLYIAVALVPENAKTGMVPGDMIATLPERITAALRPWQFVLFFVITIGGIYGGILRPKEAAGVGCFGALLLGFMERCSTVSGLLEALRSAAITTAVLFMTVIGATMFANLVVQTRLPNLLIANTDAMELAPLTVMVVIICLNIVLGCFLEGIGMVLITVPAFLPAITDYGYDPLWFGIIVVIVVELGLITPPVGMNIFIIQAQAPDVRLGQLYTGVVPLLVAPIVLIILLFGFPQIALWLPDLLY